MLPAEAASAINTCDTVYDAIPEEAEYSMFEEFLAVCVSVDEAGTVQFAAVTCFRA